MYPRGWFLSRKGICASRYEEAIRLLLEVIKLAPNLPDPYHTLGLLHEASNNQRKALDFYMIAVHLTPRDISLWRRLAALSTDLGFLRQAIYCLTKVSIDCAHSQNERDQYTSVQALRPMGGPMKTQEEGGLLNCSRCLLSACKQRISCCR